MRGLRTDRTAQTVIAGHAFMQNVRRGHYELGVDARPALRVTAAFIELAQQSDTRSAGSTRPQTPRNATEPSAFSAGKATCFGRMYISATSAYAITVSRTQAVTTAQRSARDQRQMIVPDLGDSVAFKCWHLSAADVLTKRGAVRGTVPSRFLLCDSSIQWQSRSSVACSV